MTQNIFPSSKHKLLDAFVGKWSTEGQIHESPLCPAGKIQGTDTYEWFPGGFFLLHHVDVRMGEQQTKVVEIIGYDTSGKTYPMHSFDNQGNHAVMQARVEGNTWTFIGESMRFTGAFSTDGNTITGKWELFNDGKWLHWMDVKLTKAGGQ